MDWFERLTGLNPDGGSGSFEMALVIFIAALILIGTTSYIARRSRRVAQPARRRRP